MPHLKRTFTREELDEIGAPDDLPANVEVADEHIESRRWVELRELLFRHDDHVWSVVYQQGLTEDQEDTDPWFGGDTVPATAMEERRATVTRWEPVDADETTHPMSDASLFGLTVEYVEPDSDDEKPGWRVYLPHQCDDWRIDEANAYEDPTDQATALARLDAFIAEAQTARDALANGQSVEWNYLGGEMPYRRLPRRAEVATDV